MTRISPVSIHRTRSVARIKQLIIQRALDSAYNLPPTSERTAAIKEVCEKFSLPPWTRGVRVDTASANEGSKKQHVINATENKGH